MYEVFDHTADIGLRIRAATLEELFCDAGRALFSLIVGNLDDVRTTEQTTVALAGEPDGYEYLLFDWLSELLRKFDMQHLLLAKFEVQISADRLQATAWGETIDPTRHRLEHEVKAITYHGLKVNRDASGWQAEVIVDI